MRAGFISCHSVRFIQQSIHAQLFCASNPTNLRNEIMEKTITTTVLFMNLNHKRSQNLKQFGPFSCEGFLFKKVFNWCARKWSYFMALSSLLSHWIVVLSYNKTFFSTTREIKKLLAYTLFQNYSHSNILFVFIQIRARLKRIFYLDAR